MQHGSDEKTAPTWSRFCAYGAPMFAVPMENAARGWQVFQGNCNHWDCPRCGERIAAKHYGRIAHGARQMEKSGAGLRMLTLTCKGSGLSVTDAQAGFLTWVNKLQTAMRARTTRAGLVWAYAAVTERQKRGHPHLHSLTTFTAHDEELRQRWKMKTVEGELRREYYDTLRSDWLQARLESAGLGEQYDIQELRSVEAASRYVAKYLFKQSALETWPKGWRRVRYSRSWPKLPEREDSKAVCLMTDDQWREFRMARPEYVRLRDADEQHGRILLDGLRGSGTRCSMPDGEIKVS